jgi:hypothetical protein
LKIRSSSGVSSVSFSSSSRALDSSRARFSCRTWTARSKAVRTFLRTAQSISRAVSSP